MARKQRQGGRLLGGLRGSAGLKGGASGWYVAAREGDEIGGGGEYGVLFVSGTAKFYPLASLIYPLASLS